MKSLKLLSLILLTTLMLVACGSNKERTYIDISYLQENAIDNLDEYLKDDNTNSTNEKIAEESKKKFIRWTATVKKINYSTKITLQENGLPLIEVNLKERISKEVKVGDIITVSGALDKYEYGSFITSPKWKMKDGIILETSEEDKQIVLDYQKEYSDAVALKTREEQEKSAALKKEIEKEVEKLAPVIEIIETVDYASNSIIFHIESNAKSMKELEKVVQSIRVSEKKNKDGISRDAIDIYFYPIGTSEYIPEAIYAHAAIAFNNMGSAQTLIDRHTFKIKIYNDSDEPETKTFRMY